MLKVLFIGDVSGRVGREAIAKLLPKIKKENKIDLVIANADNIAHGKGVTEATIKELMDSGIDFFTGGDHAFDREKSLENVYPSDLPILRPANWPQSAPGKGFFVLKKNKFKVLIINLIGRVFFKTPYDCPFREVDRILANPSLPAKNLSAIIIDIHAEATSEKVALKNYLDGRVSAVIGTHTHVQTADEEITKNKTAYITDAGMAGFADGIIGVEKEKVLETYLDGISRAHVIPDRGRAIFNAVVIAIDEKTRKAKSIKRITEFVEIK
ncbi:MAG: TIGR00282 family metallophosphoesterase [Patescibacteria group bacterium]|jgi:hypothetical protein